MLSRSPIVHSAILLAICFSFLLKQYLVQLHSYPDVPGIVCVYASAQTHTHTQTAMTIMYDIVVHYGFLDFFFLVLDRNDPNVRSFGITQTQGREHHLPWLACPYIRAFGYADSACHFCCQCAIITLCYNVVY